MADDLTEAELDALREALAGGSDLVAPGGQCEAFRRVVLWGDGFIGFSEERGLPVTDADRRRIRRLLAEAGQRLIEVALVGETYRERLESLSPGPAGAEPAGPSPGVG